MATNRLTYVDTAKLIAIFLVILGHTKLISSPLFTYLYSFHVPLFFMLFGFVLYNVENQSFVMVGGGKITKLIQRIVVPYFVFALILGERPNSFEMLYTVIYGSSKTIGYVTGSHLWFLPCYFISVVLFYLTVPIKNDKRISALIKMVTFAILAYFTRDEIVSNFTKDGLPWGANAALMGCSLIYLGYLIRPLFDVVISRIGNTRWKYGICSVVLLIIGLAIITINKDNHVNIAFASYGIVPVYLIANGVMLLSVLSLSKAIDNTYFSYYGAYTFPIYAFHLLVLGVFVAVFSKVGLSGMLNMYIECAIVSILTLITTCLIIKPLLKFMPNLVGVFK